MAYGNGMRLVTSKNRAIQKYLETLSGHNILVQFESRSTKRNAILLNKIKRSYPLWHTACRVHWESDMHEDQGSTLSKGKRDSKTACCSLTLIRNVVHKVCLYKKQDHLGNRNKMRRATVKPEATLLTTEYLVYRSQRWNCRMHGEKIMSQSWLRCSRNISTRNNSLKTWVKKQEINKLSEESQKLLVDMNSRDLRTLRQFCKTTMSWLQCFSAIGIIFAVAGEKLKCSGRSNCTAQMCLVTWGRILIIDHDRVLF